MMFVKLGRCASNADGRGRKADWRYDDRDSAHIRHEDLVNVTYEEIRTEGTKKIYKIKLAQPLAPGEYAVAFKQSYPGIDTGANLPATFFDFGVDR